MGSDKAQKTSAIARVSAAGAVPLAVNAIESTIHLLRGQRVMLDSDLATLYGVELRSLIQAVKRNKERFPRDFMFQITDEEWDFLRSQNGISKMPSDNEAIQGTRGGRRYQPYVFTQEGVAMLSGVLRSEQAVKVNIEIMRAFVRFRHLLATHQELINRLDNLEQRYDKQLSAVFEAIRQMVAEPSEQAPPVGFRLKD
ncbi:MAG: ORF6N domain-containing protein [Vampirovibrionales bacterium]|nr:ORF6N domain-containing protein [Vampirovibrionales bacterium]